MTRQPEGYPLTKVIADITMSLDGFVTGPDPDLEHGLGHGGEPLHEWAFSDDPVDAAQLRTGTERSGAVVMGRRLFDIVDSPHGWDDEVAYGAREAGSPPFFVVTHGAPETRRLELDFTFVTDGVASAIERARKAAVGKDVIIMGAATSSDRRSTPRSSTSCASTSRRSCSATGRRSSTVSVGSRCVRPTCRSHRTRLI